MERFRASCLSGSTKATELVRALKTKLAALIHVTTATCALTLSHPLWGFRARLSSTPLLEYEPFTLCQ